MQGVYSRGDGAMGFRWATAISLLSALWIGLAPASPAAAQAYVWKDKHGDVHMSDSLHEVPAEYRGQVEERKLESIQVDPGLASPYGPQGAKAKEDDGWRQIVQKALVQKVDEVYPKLAPEKRATMVTEVMNRLTTLLLSMGISFLATGFAFVHAIVNRHPAWAAFHVFVGVTVPVYAFICIDSAYHKFMTIAGWLAFPLVSVTTQIAIVRALEMSNKPFVY